MTDNFSQKDVSIRFEQIIKDIQRFREAGQKEYAGVDKPAFSNFNKLAVDLQVSRGTILWVYLTKHLDGIRSYLNGHKSQREDVRGRIKDAIVYLMLLHSMVDEDEHNAQDRTTMGVGSF